jgi:hypothetical protein
VQYAKDNNLMICTGYSDDNISLYWAFEEEVGLSSSKSFRVFKCGDRYEWIIWSDEVENLQYQIENNILADLACWAIGKFLEEKAIQVKVDYNNDSYLFDMSDNKHPTFEILEDGEKYCIWCVVDLSSLTR